MDDMSETELSVCLEALYDLVRMILRTDPDLTDRELEEFSRAETLLLLKDKGAKDG